MDKLMAMLLTGTAATGLHAQDAVPVAPVTPAEQTTPANPAVPPTIEFRGADGNPLPADIQKQLEEEFRKNPPPRSGAPRPSTARNGDIVVTGERPRGSVIGNIPPERTFGALDIRAFGASNVAEFVQALGSQVSSNRGRVDGGPVTLLNGRRVSDFAETARIPTEAIERTEIFPEELALKYGYRADQKVLNIVTFQRFSSRVGQISHVQPTEGGRNTAGVVADYFSIQGDTRYNLGAEYSRSGTLLESERNIVQPTDTPDLGRFRTLLPQTDRLAFSGLVSGHLLDDVSSTLNGGFEVTGAKSLLGLGRDGPLRRDTGMRTLKLGTTQNGRAGKWLWTLTGNYSRTSSETLTDTSVGRPRDEAASINALANADLVFAGPVLKLPAGPLFLSARGGLDVRDFTATSRRSGVEQRTELSRDRAAIQANLDLPIIGRDGASRVGSLAMNANLGVERLSDLGTLRTIGYGLTWSPIAAINLIASATDEEGAPTVEQLGGPIGVTPNFRTFDFTRREVIDVTRLFGGNPDLRSDDRHVVRIGLNVRPIAKTDLTFSVDYVATRIDDPIAAFPILTPTIEAAFPERFIRDSSGRLLRIDGRPLNFERSSQRQLRSGVNFTRPLGAVPQGIQGTGRVFNSEADARKAYPGAHVIMASPGSPAARRAENMASRLFLSLYHNWTLEDSIVTREGGPMLDMLEGGAIDVRGGRPRHEVEFRGGVFKRGLGVRVAANWRSGTTVRGLGGAAGDLRFDDFTTVSINLFANLAERFGGTAAPVWLKGVRATVGITNLFNIRPRVRDDAGATPLSYQPAYLDPVGRSVILNLRKVF